MAFPRRRRFTGRRFPRFRRFRRRGPPFARASFDRVVLFNNLDATPFNQNECGPIELEYCGADTPEHECGPLSTNECEQVPPQTDLACRCCTNVIRYSLLSQDALQGLFTDSVTIVRMYGVLRFRIIPQSPVLAQCDTRAAFTDRANWIQLYNSFYSESWFAGIRKHLRSQDAYPRNLQNPIPDTAIPGARYDDSESSPPWLWRKMRLWQPRMSGSSQVAAIDNPVGVCSQVTGTSPGTTTTACSEFFRNVETEPCDRWGDINYLAPPWHTFPIKTRKHIRLQRDEGLTLSLTFKAPSAIAGFPSWPCLSTTQFPFPASQGVGFLGTIQTFLRVGAVLRLH